MMLTIQIKLLPSKKQGLLIDKTMREYITLVNDIIDYSIAIMEMPKLSSANVKALLPACLRDQCRIDARSVWRKTLKKGGRFPVLKKPVSTWNNQNYTIEPDGIVIPLWVNGKSKRIMVRAAIPSEIYDFLMNHKLGTLRITQKNGKYIAQIAYQEICGKPVIEGRTMGVDLGILCPAVSVTNGGKTKFHGNGRQNKFVRRRHKAKRRTLGKAKKLNAIRKMADKEQRWMRDQDHKISRSIVNEAISQNVSTIKLEKLSSIRSTARTSRKNNSSLHSWSFYRLSKFIEYKARMAGIEVKYVNPKYTSQTCPVCGIKHKTNSRTYLCASCGYRTHRDRVGAVNICHAA